MEKTMAGKFEFYKDKAGEFRFRLKAGNGEPILASEGYASRAACTNGIESVRKNCLDDERFEKKTTSSGKFRFNLKAKNGQVIGTSQNYENENARDNGIGAVGRAAPEAAVVDQT
jgi:uncharacterized protein YegP (UPF0339 family)